MSNTPPPFRGEVVPSLRMRLSRIQREGFSHLVAPILAALVLVAARLSALAAHHIAIVLLVALVITTGHFILIC